MKKYLIILLIFISVIPAGVSECVWSRDIKEVEEGYLYKPSCHKKAGKLINDAKDREKQVEKLEKVIELKDLGLIKSHERINLWRDTSFKLEDRVNAMDKIKDRNKWIWFGFGILVTGGAVWGAGQLRR